MLPWASHQASYTAVILHPGPPPPRRRRRLGHLPARQAQRAAVLRRNLAIVCPPEPARPHYGSARCWARPGSGSVSPQPEPSRRPRRGRSMCPAGRPSEAGSSGGTCRRLLVNPDWAGQSHPKTPARAGVTRRKEANVHRHWNCCPDYNHRPGHLDAAPPLTTPAALNEPGRTPRAASRIGSPLGGRQRRAR
jgi:hypothetical protein